MMDSQSERNQASSSVPPTGLLTQVSRRAMATEFVLMLPAHASEAVEVAVTVLEQLDDIEQALTIYRTDSEVSRINQLAAQQPVCVTEQTFRLIENSIAWSQRTDGAFDITAGPLVEVWGFTTRSGRKPSDDQIRSARSLTGYQSIELDQTNRAIRFGKAGMSINLGAIGKGDALDRLADQLRQQGLNDFLLHGGNSSVIASGDQVSGSGMGWAVGVAHPTKPNRRLAGFWLRNAALATSGSGKQFFHHRGKRYGHVIDPRTGQPAGDMMSITVVSPSAADADAAATGLFVLGSTWIAERHDEDWMPAAIMVKPSTRQDSAQIESKGTIDWIDDSGDDVSQPSDA